MKKLVSLVTVALFVVGMAPSVSAAQSFGFGAHAGISVPVGDYADTDANVADAGFAELGFSGGLDLWYSLLMVPGLSVYTSVDVIAHSTDDGANPDLASDAGYLFVPVMTGLRFDVPAGPMGLYFTGQVGVTFAHPPATTFGGTEATGDIDTKFGFAIGGGVQVTDFIYGGLKYYPVGDVSWSWDNELVTETRPASFFDIYLGVGVR